MVRRPPGATRPEPLFPSPPLFRSAAGGIRVVAQADRAIPPRPGGMAPEQFGAGVRKAAVAAFALAAQPELVEVAADAGAQVPAHGIGITSLALVAAALGPRRAPAPVSPYPSLFMLVGNRGA